MIIPTNPSFAGFYKNLFWKHKQHLWGLIEPEQFDKIIENSSKELCVAYSTMRKKDAESIKPWKTMSMTLSTILLLCFIVLAYFGIKEDEVEYTVAGFACGGLGVLLASIVWIKNFIEKPEDDYSF